MMHALKYLEVKTHITLIKNNISIQNNLCGLKLEKNSSGHKNN